MLCNGIHNVPTMVSQISPLFHTSTVRPRSSLLISLEDGVMGKIEKKEGRTEKLIYSMRILLLNSVRKVSYIFS